MDDNEYSKEYSDDSFWEKVKSFAVTAGKDVIQKALVLYHCFKDPQTPVWAKATIIGALGYFITPIDAIPDLTPIVGFTDDLGALAVAMATVAMHIKQEHIDKAEEKMKIWFDK